MTTINEWSKVNKTNRRIYEKERETRHTWNHRIVKDGKWYSIREVHYSNDVPELTSEEPEGLIDESVEDLKEHYEQMAEAFEQPVLNYEDL